MKKVFSVNGKLYYIPEEKVSEFLKDMPNAEETKHYKVGDKEYDIPLSKVSEFEADKKDATSTPLNLKKKRSPKKRSRFCNFFRACIIYFKRYLKY